MDIPEQLKHDTWTVQYIQEYLYSYKDKAVYKEKWSMHKVPQLYLISEDMFAVWFASVKKCSEHSPGCGSPHSGVWVSSWFLSPLKNIPVGGLIRPRCVNNEDNVANKWGYGSGLYTVRNKFKSRGIKCSTVWTFDHMKVLRKSQKHQDLSRFQVKSLMKLEPLTKFPPPPQKWKVYHCANCLKHSVMMMMKMACFCHVF